MTISMYGASVPAFARQLNALLGLLDKAQAHAEARKFSPDSYLALRMAPDMLPFTKQIQIACDMAKGAVARLAGVEIPKWDDNEATLDDLRARIRKTVDFVKSVTAAQIDGSEEREVVLTLRLGEMKFSGQDYLLNWALPNFYFHATTTYAMLRQAGVEVGKRDFLA